MTGRFELFIDLIWVGIVGNIADHFSEQAYGPESVNSTGRAIFEFIVLFLLAWRFWMYLQQFMSKYHTHDVLESVWIIWALILAMMYGNNAPYLFDNDVRYSLAISLYLVFKASLLVIEAYYSLHLPHLRKRVILQTALSMPLLGLWLPAYWFYYPTKAALIFCAVTLEYWAAAVLDVPWAQRFLQDDRKEIINWDHWIERLQDFYIIILGDGVLLLVKGSPLGSGITAEAGAGVSALWVYYVLSCLFFNGDLSRRYVHAVRRTWWRGILWHG